MDFRRKNIDLVGKLPLWFGISLALILVGMVSWAAFGLNLGIDFKGGGQFQYRIPYTQRPTAAGADIALIGKVRSALETQGLRTLPQIAGGDTLVIKTDAKGQNELRGQRTRIEKAIAPIFAGGKTESGATPSLAPIGQQFVGPVIGEELKRNAILGVVLGVALIALWIYIRYNFAGDGARYAVAGIIALLHDVLVLIGLFALIGKIDPRIEIDGAFIAALLTVVGYSINDSVVIFDRLRENLRVRRKEPFEKVINDSLLETMSRSINTGLTVLIMLVALLWFGGESIYNFVLAMLVGIASGLYSSIFNASMVLVAWHRWDEKKAAQLKATRTSGVSSAARNATPRVNNARAATATSSTRSATTLPARRGSFASPTLATPTLATATPPVSSDATSDFAAPIATSPIATSTEILSSAVSPNTMFSDAPAAASNAGDNATQKLSQELLIEQDGGATASDFAADTAINADNSNAENGNIDNSDFDLIDADDDAPIGETSAARALRVSKKSRAKRRF